MTSDIQAHVDHIAATINREDWTNGASAKDLGLSEEEWFEANTAWGYLSDALSFEWVVDSGKQYRGAIVLVTFGGPNIWIDTRRSEVFGSWGGESASARLGYASVRELDEALSAIYAC